MNPTCDGTLRVSFWWIAMETSSNATGTARRITKRKSSSCWVNRLLQLQEAVGLTVATRSREIGASVRVSVRELAREM